MSTHAQAAQDHTEVVRSSLAVNVVTGLLARLGYLCTRFFVPPFVLAHISIEAYGLWSTAFILVSYVGVSTIGVSNVYIKYIAEYTARREYQKANSLLSTGLCLTVPLATMIFAGISGLWPKVSQWLHISSALAADAQYVVLLTVGSFLVTIALSAFNDTLVASQQSTASQGIWVTAYLLETVLIFSLIGSGRGVRGLAEAYLIRTLLEVGLAFLVARRTFPWLRLSFARVSREALTHIWAFGGIAQLTSLLAIGLNSAERALAAPMLGLEASGLLDIGKKLPSMAASIPSAFAGSLVPASSYLQAGLKGQSQHAEAVRKLLLKGARYMNLVAGYLCGFIVVAAHPLLWVWLGREIPNAALLTALFGISTQIHLMTGPGTSVLKGLNRPTEELYYCVPNLGLLLTFVLVLPQLGYRWSPVSIACLVALSTVLSAAMFLVRSSRVLGVGAFEYLRKVALPGALPYAVAALAVWPVQSYLITLPRWSAGAVVAVLGVLYSLLTGIAVDRLIFDGGERLWFRAVARHRLEPLIRRRRLKTPSHQRAIPNGPEELMGDLWRRYRAGSSPWRQLRYHCKRSIWQFTTIGTLAVKRSLDIVGAATALLLLWPLFLLVAVLVKLTDRGPVLFWQQRVGQWGEEFAFPKFRSMYVNAEQRKQALLSKNDHGASITFKMRNDPRVTAVGRLIRRGSIDELPQLWCVLRGQMSLVGPRPPLPREVELYSIADRRRLDIRPGLTCIWQVSGRGEIPFPRQVELDLAYIESQSLWVDLKLLLQTIPAVLFGRGAY